MEYEEALLIGGTHDGTRVKTYPGQGSIKMYPREELFHMSQYTGAHGPRPDDAEIYLLHRVHDSRGFHRLIGQMPTDYRGPMQALYEGYKKENANA